MQKEITTLEDLLAEETIVEWYLQSNPQNTAFWESWAAENNTNRLLLNEAKLFLQSLQFKGIDITEEKVNSAWHEVSNNISVSKHISIKKYTKWATAAAAVFILFFAGFYWLKYTTSARIIKTEYGQISEKLLPDGSSVILNANSKITTNSFHAGNTREVWLEGEAYFKVHKTQNKDRFIVHTGKIDVIVTGTQFNVVNRNNKTSVYLKEGSVYIRSQNGSEVHMKPGDYIEMDNKDSLLFKPGNDKNILAWQDKLMIFDNTTLQEVAQKIKEVYGVEVTVDSSIQKKPIWGVMPNNDLSVLLQALEASQDFKIINKNNSITILPR